MSKDKNIEIPALSSDLEGAVGDAIDDIDSITNDFSLHDILEKEQVNGSLNPDAVTDSLVKKIDILSKENRTKESYVQLMAFEMYKEYDKYAKRYLWQYSLDNGYINRMSRSKGSIIGTKFVPFTYKIVLKKTEVIETVSKVIASGEATAKQARISGAVNLGFNHDSTYLRVWENIPDETKEVLKTNTKYIMNVKEYFRLLELKTQILGYKGSLWIFRKSWLEDVEKQISDFRDLVPVFD